MFGGDARGDGEPEAEAVLLRRVRRLEDERPLLGRDPGPVVGDDDAVEGALGRAHAAETDDDGRRDAMESALSNVEIRLSGTDATGQPVSQSKLTGADGSYIFDALRAGTACRAAKEQGASQSVSQTHPIKV